MSLAKELRDTVLGEYEQAKKLVFPMFPIKVVKRQRLMDAIKSIKDSLDWLPLTAWWYILLQSGIEPTSRHARLLKATQGGKLSLEELIEATIGDQDADDEDDLFQKFKKPDSVKILNLLESPIFAGMDSEAIAAIMAELKSQLWERIFENEEDEVEKLRHTTEAIKGAA